MSIRNVIDASIRGKKGYFPLDDLMIPTAKKRSLTINDETIEDILSYKFGDGRIYPLLMELCKETSGRVYHVDHMWPQAIMSKKSEIKKYGPTLNDSECNDYKRLYSFLANLQLLEPIPNQEKSKRLFDEWLRSVHPDTSNRYYEYACIPIGISYSFDNFIEFFNPRRSILSERIKIAFPTDFNAILERYSLR